MWLARRAESKYVDPGKLDNMVAGRISRGYSPMQTLVKESLEEAGIDAALSGASRASGAVRCKRITEEGFHKEIIFVHDLILPDTFEPKNQDGEVTEFTCVPIADLLTMLENPSQFTAEAALVIVDCLLRRGYLHSHSTPSSHKRSASCLNWSYQ